MDSPSNLAIPTKSHGVLGLLCIVVVAVSGTLLWGPRDRSNPIPLASKIIPVAEAARLCGDLQNWSCPVKE